jgi:hypothetical protein
MSRFRQFRQSPKLQTTKTFLLWLGEKQTIAGPFLLFEKSKTACVTFSGESSLANADAKKLPTTFVDVGACLTLHGRLKKEIGQ